MGNTPLTFRDRYYKYGGGKEIEERVLTIGGYESAWSADLVASYIMEDLSDIFDKTTKYLGIYHDDGIVIFEGNWSSTEITN